jgi:hypothetical protein
VRISAELKRYVVDLVQATRTATGVSLGASPRASLALMKAAQALALLDGGEFVTPEHVQEIALPVIAHRMVVDSQARFTGVAQGIVCRRSSRRCPCRRSRGRRRGMRRLLFRAFRWTWVVQQWLARRFTRAGYLVLGGVLPASVVGLDTNRTLAYQAFAFLVALLGAALLASLTFRGRFSVRRAVPRFGTAGERLTYQVSCEMREADPRTGHPPRGLRRAGPRSPIPRGAEPGEDRRNCPIAPWLPALDVADERRRGPASECPVPAPCRAGRRCAPRRSRSGTSAARRGDAGPA